MVAAAAAANVVIVGKLLIEQSSAIFRTFDYRRAVNGLLGYLRNNRTYYATCLRGRITSYSLLNRRRTILYSSFTVIVCQRAPQVTSTPTAAGTVQQSSLFCPHVVRILWGNGICILDSPLR